jgi:O-antigen/teichoic acid export membrane protein
MPIGSSADATLGQGHLLSGQVLLRSALWNLAGGIAPLAVAVVTIPIILRGLGTDRFGILTLAWVFIGYFSLFDFGLGRAMTQAVAQEFGKGAGDELPLIVWSGLAVMSLVGFLGGVVCFALVPTVIGHVIQVPSPLQGETVLAAQIMSATVPVVIVSTGLRGVLEAQQKFAVSNLVRIPLGMTQYLAPLAVLPFTRSLVAVLATLAGARVVGLFAFIFACIRSNDDLRRVAVSARAARRLAVFGGWISVSNFIGPILVYVDRFVIAAVTPIATVAFYTTPYEAVTRLLVIPSAVSGVLFPAFATSFVLDPKRTTTLLNRGSKYIVIGLFPLLLVSAVFAKEILSIWIDPQFAERAAPVLRWLSVGVLANSVAQVPFGLVQGSGHPRWTATLHLLELPVYVVVLFLFVTYDGIAGAAFAWALRTVIDYLVLDYMSYRLLSPASPFWRRLLLGPVGVLFVACASLVGGSTVAKILVFGPLLLLFAVVSWFVLLSAQERQLGLSVIGIGSRGRHPSPLA